MSEPLVIRQSREEEETAEILDLYPKAFPEEDLLPLVKNLLKQTSITKSLVALNDSRLIGHIAFTLGQVNGEPVALLGPLVVDPEAQGKGVGSKLVAEGLGTMEWNGIVKVFVLGDPNYYGRFGFVAEESVEPPYSLPPEWSGAWQSVLFSNAPTNLSGKIDLPEVWLDQSLWQP